MIRGVFFSTFYQQLLRTLCDGRAKEDYFKILIPLKNSLAKSLHIAINTARAQLCPVCTSMSS